jgi:hypothetical protein
MPHITLVDEQTGKEWNAIEHTDWKKDRDAGPNRLDSRSALVRLVDQNTGLLLNGKETQCFLSMHSRAVRVNFKNDATNTWWHVTQNDQGPNRKSNPNFYPIVERMIRAKRP